MNESTTGKVYGIYDMSGGAWEYVMGNYNYGSGYSITTNSGYSGYNGNDGTTTDGLPFPGSQYYNLYTTSSGVYYGHALAETKNWYSDFASFVDASYSWFVRGGNCNDTANAGLFYYYGSSGNAYSYFSVRVVQTKS